MKGVNIGIIVWVTSFDLATGDLELWCSTYCILYMYIYMYRYNTVLVNKVGGFHMADRGTELSTLFPPQTCLVNSSFCYFLSSQISIMQPFCFYPHKSYSCSMYTFITGFYPTVADSCQDKAKRYSENQDSENIEVIYAL